jgi:chitinase
VSPANGASFLSKPNIVLAATASDSNGWVTAVQFLANGTSLGVVSNYPFGAFPVAASGDAGIARIGPADAAGRAGSAGFSLSGPMCRPARTP